MPAPAEPQPSDYDGAEQTPLAGDDGRGLYMAPDGTDEKSKDEIGARNGHNIDYSEQRDRPVKRGGIGAPKGPQIGPQKGEPEGGVDVGEPGKGEPGGGVDLGEPGTSKPGGGSGLGAGSPEPEELPAQQEPGDPVSPGPGSEPVGPELPVGPVGEPLPG